MGLAADCNFSGTPDECDIAFGISADKNGNTIPDECEETCAADLTGDGIVGVPDLVAVIIAWGPFVRLIYG